MADAAGAITSGFLKSSLLKLIRTMCWFHCENTVDKKLNDINDKEIWAKLKFGSISRLVLLSFYGLISEIMG